MVAKHGMQTPSHGMQGPLQTGRKFPVPPPLSSASIRAGRSSHPPEMSSPMAEPSLVVISTSERHLLLAPSLGPAHHPHSSSRSLVTLHPQPQRFFRHIHTRLLLPTPHFRTSVYPNPEPPLPHRPGSE